VFRAIFQQAQATVESSIDHAIDRVIMAVPFLVAAGFGTAALALRLVDTYGGETGALIMAGLFVLVGLVVATFQAVSRKRRPRASASVADTNSADAPAAGETTTSSTGFSSSEKDLLVAALTTAAPVALPQLLRVLLRNLPLLAAIAAGIFVLTRPIASPGERQQGFDEVSGIAPAE
jgi:hypothetical protein